MVRYIGESESMPFIHIVHILVLIFATVFVVPSKKLGNSPIFVYV